MASPSLWHLFALVSLVTAVLSLEVTPGSDCAALCLGGSNGESVDASTPGTNSSDIVCENDQYHTTGTGIKFKNCVSCLQDSAAAKGPQSDAAWFLYNIRYAVDVCIFDVPNAVSKINSPCVLNSACSPLKDALTVSLTTPDASATYDYCTADGGKFSSWSWASCVKCLRSSDSQSYLSNFLTALKAGCQQKPADGNLIGLTGQLFSKEPVNITDPATNATLPGDGGASSTTMTVGTIVGIAVGGGLVFVGAICLFIVYFRKQKKQQQRLNTDADNYYHNHPSSHPPGSQTSSFTAINHSPYMPIADHKKSSSINSYTTTTNNNNNSNGRELQEKHTFSSNADYYDNLEYDVHLLGRETSSHYNFDPRSNHHGLNAALPTHPAYIPRAMSRQSHRDNNTTTNTPPNHPRKTNVPDSYALQTYLNAVSEEGITNTIKPPPAARMSRTPSPARSQTSHPEYTFSSAPVNMIPTTTTTITSLPPPPPPPPPPRKPSLRIPSLSLPSVPRIRVPKKYSPPQIHVQGATPVADRGETGGMRIQQAQTQMHISEPMTVHQPRFQDRPLAGRAAVLADEAPAREHPQQYEGDMPIRSGKSTLYG